MATFATSSSAISRPKVHRLPGRMHYSPRQRAMTALLSYGTAARFVFTLSSLAFIIVLSALFASRLLPGGFLSQDVSANPAGQTEVVFAQPSKTIVLKDENGTIVGQMAKITPGTTVAQAKVDNRSGQELLSIVNRH